MRWALGRDKVALLWEGEPGEVRRLTYGDLYEEVQRFANVLKGWVSTGAIALPCIWGCVRSWRLRCWRALGLARCIR